MISLGAFALGTVAALCGVYVGIQIAGGFAPRSGPRRAVRNARRGVKRRRSRTSDAPRGPSGRPML